MLLRFLALAVLILTATFLAARMQKRLPKSEHSIFAFTFIAHAVAIDLVLLVMFAWDLISFASWHFHRY